MVTQCVCAYSQTREFTPAHVRAHTHTRLPLPTRRSFSFCSWKASTVSARWWVERLVSTEALCALVSAWAREHKSRKCHRVSLAPRYYSGSFSPTISCGALSPALGGLLLTGSLKGKSGRHGDRMFTGTGQTCCLAVCPQTSHLTSLGSNFLASQEAVMRLACKVGRTGW